VSIDILLQDTAVALYAVVRRFIGDPGSSAHRAGFDNLDSLFVDVLVVGH
jgi:hypothetical protein